MRHNQTNEVEIRVVNNGFIVRPAYHEARSQVVSSTDIHVFENFESLAKWLKENLLPPMEGM